MRGGSGSVEILTPVRSSCDVTSDAMYLSPRPKALACTSDWCTAPATCDGRFSVSVRCV